MSIDYPGYNPNNVDYSLKNSTATDAFDFNLFPDPRKSIDRATANNIFYNDLAGQGLTLPNYNSTNVPVNTEPLRDLSIAREAKLNSMVPGLVYDGNGDLVDSTYNTNVMKNGTNGLGKVDPNAITGFEIGQLGLTGANTIMSALALPGQLDYMKNLNENMKLKNKGLKAKVNDYEAYRTKAKKNGLIS